jgi:hypothetical protein
MKLLPLHYPHRAVYRPRRADCATSCRPSPCASSSSWNAAAVCGTCLTIQTVCNTYLAILIIIIWFNLVGDDDEGGSDLNDYADDADDDTHVTIYGRDLPQASRVSLRIRISLKLLDGCLARCQL